MVLDDLDGLVLEVEVDVEQPRLLVLPLAEEPQDPRRERLQAVLRRRHPLVRPQWVRPFTLGERNNEFLGLSLNPGNPLYRRNSYPFCRISSLKNNF